MSCPDCTRRAQQALMQRLELAAKAHGYDLWVRYEDVGIKVLAIPVGASYGTPAALVDAFKELKLPLPMSPSHMRALKARDHSVRPDRLSHPGREKWLIDGAPPVELTFLCALQPQ